MTKYNGHRNWNAWNVSLWVANDEDHYRRALRLIGAFSTREKAAQQFVVGLNERGITRTPDGAPWTKTNVRLAMRDL